MQRYGDFRLFPKKQMISGREACGAYTKFAADTARLANEGRLQPEKHLLNIGSRGWSILLQRLEQIAPSLETFSK